MGDANRSVTLRRQSDVAFARQAALEVVTTIGATPTKRTRFVTAVSEIARNAVLHGHGGVISFEVRCEGPHKRVLARCEDRGPGIPDVALAMQPGYTTGPGLGLGLSGAQRLVDRFEIVSSPQTGTIVTMECTAR